MHVGQHAFPCLVKKIGQRSPDLSRLKHCFHSNYKKQGKQITATVGMLEILLCEDKAVMLSCCSLSLVLLNIAKRFQDTGQRLTLLNTNNCWFYPDKE